MSSPTLTPAEVITKAYRCHGWGPGQMHCTCGYECFWHEHEAHAAAAVLDALAAAGFTVVRADDITTVLMPGVRFYPGYEAITARLRTAVSSLPTAKERQ